MGLTSNTPHHTTPHHTTPHHTTPPSGACLVKIAAELEEKASDERTKQARAMLAASNAKQQEEARKRRAMLADEQSR